LEVDGLVGALEGEVADFKHLLDGRDTGDGVFGELAEAIRDGAEEAIAYVDRASTHAGDNAGVFGFCAFEDGEDDVMAGAACAAQNAENFDVHGLRGGAREDCPGGGFEAAVNFAEGKESSSGGWRNGCRLGNEGSRGDAGDGSRDEAGNKRGDFLRD
jgi:hypothetical protein